MTSTLLDVPIELSLGDKFITLFFFFNFNFNFYWITEEEEEGEIVLAQSTLFPPQNFKSRLRSAISNCLNGDHRIHA